MSVFSNTRITKTILPTCALALLMSLIGCGGSTESDTSSTTTSNTALSDPASSTDTSGNSTGDTTSSTSAGGITVNSQSFSRASSTAKIATGSDVYLATYNERLLVSWQATEPGDGLTYGVLSDYAITADGLVQQGEYNLGKQCEFTGGVTANRDGSLIAILCQVNNSAFASMTEAHAASETVRPTGLDTLFPTSNYLNLLARTGAQGFYSGDIFTASLDGKDVFVLEFVNGLKDSPDNVIFVSSASRAGNGGNLKYGHLHIEYKAGDTPEKDQNPELYNIAIKTVSNRDGNGILHTDMKEIGLQRIVDDTSGDVSYRRLRITDNYGTGLGVTHPDIAEVAYNTTLSKWGRLSSGDSKTSFATIPDYLNSNKGNQNPVDNMYEEFSITQITNRDPLDIISLANTGFMAVANSGDNNELVAKILPGTIGDYSNQDWVSLGYTDTGYGKLENFSSDGELGTTHLVGWSSAAGEFSVQMIDSDLVLSGEPVTLESSVCWGKGNWAFMDETGCIYAACASTDENMQLTSMCNQ